MHKLFVSLLMPSSIVRACMAMPIPSRLRVYNGRAAMMHRCMRAATCSLLLMMCAPATAQADLEAFLRKDNYGTIKISPNGDYYAATVPLEDRTALVVIRRADGKPTAKIAGGAHTVVNDFHWANATRVVASMAERFGLEERPYPNGQLYAVNADGSRGTYLTAPEPGEEFKAVFLMDLLASDDRNVLVSVMPFDSTPQTRVEKLDVNTGRRTPVAAAPVRRARFVADRQGNVRLAVGAGHDNVSKLYYRDGRTDPWRLLNDEAVTGVVETPLAFSDEGIAYLSVERTEGPDALVSWNPADGKRIELLRDPAVNPHTVLWNMAGDLPVGALFMRDGIRSRFFDEKSSIARRYRSLENAFPGQAVKITSATTDGQLLLVNAWSDRSPGDFFLFDAVTGNAALVFSRRQWFDPALMPATRSVDIVARDGVALHGYLTEPPGSAGARRPLVVMPHGGPFGVFDEWGFDDDAMLLAQAGYAVLRVNFRGSGNYGRQFEQAGARQWGRKMQNDLTDATRWAIESGITHADRICIFGASYGAYAALMGAATEPDLYRCAVGYVGVYDLIKRYDDDSGNNRSTRVWLDQWVGERDTLHELSVIDKASRIKVPVFLAAGGKDTVTPIEHTKRLEKALRTSGNPAETLYFPNEGHGFYTEPHRREFYRRLLEFLGTHLKAEPN